MEKSLVSIIIPTYNRAQLLLETLDSISAQTYAEWECIIVDDKSTDDTFEIVSGYLKKDSRFQLFTRPENKHKGANACRNYGLLRSKGEYIQFFDSDDLMEEEHIAKKVAALESLKDKDYVICRFDTFTDHTKKKKIKTLRAYKEINNIYQDYILGYIGIFTFSVMWRRKIFNNNVLFDEYLQQFQDLDLYSKIIFNNRKFVMLNEVLIYVRRNNNSITTLNSRLDIKTDSFLLVKERIINRTPNDKAISLSVIKGVLGVMRYKMASRDYFNSDKCLRFLRMYNYKLSLSRRMSLYRINLFYNLFKIIKKGDTKFKSLLKL